MDHTHTELTNRLRSLGRAPVPTEISARTMSAITGQCPRVRRWSRPAVALAAVAGFTAGSLGLASAGALPDSVQDVAHDVLDHVGVDVPVGTERFNDPAVCPGGPYKNHGDYVRQHKDDPNAAHSDCGKPLASLDHSSDNSTGSDDSDTSSASTDSDAGGGSSNSTHSSAADDAPGQTKDKHDGRESQRPDERPGSDSSSSSSQAN